MQVLKKALLCAFFIVFNLSFASAEECTTAPDLTNLPSGTVKRVVDGDTLHLTDGRKIRLLQINAPELFSGQNKRPQPFASEAQRYLSKRASVGSRIYLQFDEKTKDRYQRLLAFVYHQDGSLLNRELVEQGLAQMMVLPPNIRLANCLWQIEQKARTQNKGIWDHPFYAAHKPKTLTYTEGHTRITGKISEVQISRKNIWLIVDELIWVGIPKNRQTYFRKQQWQTLQGKQLDVRGYLYYSHGESRIKWQHPANGLLPEFFPDKPPFAKQ